MYDTSVYDTLPPKHIRLLAILTDQAEDEVHCRLTVHAIEECPKYVALSYTWGRPPENGAVTINGRRCLVRKNLWRFLREARRTHAEDATKLWIDAVCIDQSNLAERAQQVALMPTIYQNAESVTIWLGPAYAGSDVAMRGLAAIARSRKKNAWQMTQAAGIHAAVLSRRAYWTRLWVFQEVVLARHIMLMCGGSMAPWAPFREILLTAHASRYGPSVEYQIIKDSPAVAIARRTQLELQSLYDLILSTQELRCVEPKDRVYALLGVCSAEFNNIAPDYSKPLPVLLNDILRRHHAIKPPSDLEEVELQCQELNRCFQSRDLIYQLNADDSTSLTQTMDSHPLKAPENWSMSLWWAVHHNHRPVIVKCMAYALKWISRAIQQGALPVLDFVLNAIAQVGRDYTDLRNEYGNPQGSWDRSLDSLVDPICVAFHQGQWEALELPTDDQDIQKLVSAAAGLGQLELVEVLLDRGDYLPIASEAAVTRDRGAVFDMLLERWAGQAPRGRSHREPLLHIAARMGHLDIARRLLAAGVDIDELHTLSALCVAAYSKQVVMVEFLLDAGAATDIMDEDMGHMLTHVLCLAHVDELSILLNASAKPTTSHSESIFGPAAFHLHSSFATNPIVKLCLDRGVDLLAEAPGHMLICAVSKPKDRTLEFLLNAGLNPDAGRAGRELGMTMTMCHSDAADQLSHAGVDADDHSPYYLTPLAQAICYQYEGQHRYVQLLLDAGADPNRLSQGPGSKPPLALATDVNSCLNSVEEAPAIITTLLDAGADPNVSPELCASVLQGVASQGLDDTLKRLLEKASFIPDDLLLQIAYSCDASTLEAFITTTPVNLHHKGKFNTARGGLDSWATGVPLQAALWRNDLQSVQVLLSAGVEMCPGALQMAAYQGNLSIMKELLDRGADVDAHELYEVKPQNEVGQRFLYEGTALGAAQLTGYPGVLDLLHERGAKIDSNTVLFE